MCSLARSLELMVTTVAHSQVMKAGSDALSKQSRSGARLPERLYAADSLGCLASQSGDEIGGCSGRARITNWRPDPGRLQAAKLWGGVTADGLVGDDTRAVSLHAASATLETAVGLGFVIG